MYSFLFSLFQKCSLWGLCILRILCSLTLFPETLKAISFLSFFSLSLSLSFFSFPYSLLSLFYSLYFDSEFFLFNSLFILFSYSLYYFFLCFFFLSSFFLCFFSLLSFFSFSFHILPKAWSFGAACGDRHWSDRGTDFAHLTRLERWGSERWKSERWKSERWKWMEANESERWKFLLFVLTLFSSFLFWLCCTARLMNAARCSSMPQTVTF